MDQPSAQSVGREFVRQYYTMLNEAPQFLHRFYSHNSSFVHGGVEKPGEEQAPAVGQIEINKKIESLGFKDCHAKIRQVDSQSSVEGSVVIQVVGELSNNGSMMRRFMQTFVLVPQSPKKYYLHNDIFRYQDEVFQDLSGADVDGTTEEYFEHESAEEEVASDGQQQQRQQMLQLHMQQQQQQQLTQDGMKERPAGGYYDVSGVQAGQPQQQQAMSNGDAYAPHESDSTASVDHPTTDSSAPSVVTVAVEQPEEAVAGEMVAEGDKVAEAEEVGVKKEEGGENQEAGESTTVQPEPQPVVVATQKLSWAAMASKNTPASSSASSLSFGGAATVAAKPQAAVKPEPKPDQRPAGSPTNGALPQRQPRSYQQQQAVPSEASGEREGGWAPQQARTGFGGAENGRGSGSAIDGGRGGGQEDDGSRGRPFGAGGPPAAQVYPDSQQVFVGNVPHNVNDQELREYFEQYGPVADIRINRKTSYNLPNFGFVSFETVEAVQNILSSMPLPKLHGKHRINVEEKKPREELAANRPRSGTRPPMQGPNGGGKPFPRESYSPRGGGRGGYNNGGGRGQPYNGGGSYSSVGGPPGRSYTRSCSSDDGRSGPPLAGPATTPNASQQPQR